MSLEGREGDGEGGFELDWDIGLSRRSKWQTWKLRGALTALSAHGAFKSRPGL